MIRRALPLLFLLVLLAGAGQAWGAASPSPTKQLKRCVLLCERGEKAIRQGDLRRAEREFRRAAKILPAFPPAHLGLGHVAMQHKRYETALKEYRQAQVGYREMGEAFFALRAKRWAQSTQELNALRDSLSVAENNYGAIGISPLQLSQIWNAITRVESMEQPDPETAEEAPAEVHFFIGNALFQLGRYNDALEAWLTCRDRNPAFPLVHNNLALIYWRRGERQKARASLARAEELGFPVNPDFKAVLESTPR